MADKFIFYLRWLVMAVCLWFAFVSILAPLVFTFSREELTMSPKMPGLYLDKMNSALDEKDLGRARYWMRFVDEYADELNYTKDSWGGLEMARNRLGLELGEYDRMVAQRGYWQGVEESRGNFRDAKYMLARAELQLLNAERAAELLNESRDLDPQCGYCTDARSSL